MTKSLITDDNLKESDVPAYCGERDFEAFSEFALTIDGYQIYGSPSELERAVSNMEISTLSDMRLKLFYIQRKCHMSGFGPSPDDEKEIQKLLFMIKTSLSKNNDCGIHFKAIDKKSLTAKQTEIINYQLLSSELANYGYKTIKLQDDWHEADFLMQHVNDENIIKVQLKGRLLFSKKYIGKSIYIAFPENMEWFIYPHDDLLSYFEIETNITKTKSWLEKGEYHFPQIPQKHKNTLSWYRVCSSSQ